MDNKPSNGLPIDYMTRDMFASLMSANNILASAQSQSYGLIGRVGLREEITRVGSLLNHLILSEYETVVKENAALRQELLEMRANVTVLRRER